MSGLIYVYGAGVLASTLYGTYEMNERLSQMCDELVEMCDREGIYTPTFAAQTMFSLIGAGKGAVIGLVWPITVTGWMLNKALK